MRSSLLLVLVMASAALAAPNPKLEAALSEARSAIQEGNHAVAAERYGRILAAAQSRADIFAEEQIVRAMRQESLSVGRDALLPLMAALDGVRSGAHISAPLLAREIILLATRDGDTSGVKEAEAVLSGHARKSKSGLCASAMRDYAAGMVAIAEGTPDAAAAPLGRALTTMVDQGWSDLAVHAGTELAATFVVEGKAAEAAAALSRVASALPRGTDAVIADLWRKLVTTRLAEAPDEVLAVVTQACEKFAGPRSATAAGGRGGAGLPGGRAGQNPRSKVGKVWDKLPANRPFVTAKRTADGFEVREAFDRKYEATQPFQHGVKYLDDGGITLAFWGQGVTLAMVDLIGNRGQPGEGSHLHRYQLVHRLARGEVWGVSRKGVVTIRRR